MTFRIYFQDLCPAVQEDIVESLRGYLLAAGEIESREPDEDPAAFERRVWEEVDHYINCHNGGTMFEV